MTAVGIDVSATSVQQKCGWSMRLNDHDTVVYVHLPWPTDDCTG